MVGFGSHNTAALQAMEAAIALERSERRAAEETWNAKMAAVVAAHAAALKQACMHMRRHACTCVGMHAHA